MVWLLVVLLFAHVTITAAGFLFADAEIMRCGNDQLLDDLEEGLIITE